VDYRGNKLFYTTWNTLVPSSNSLIGGGLSAFAAVSRATSKQMDYQRIQDEIDHYRATHSQLTREDRNVLDDLILQRDAARNSKIKSTVLAIPGIPGGGSIFSFFDKRAHDSDFALAQNALHDARQDHKEEPSEDTVIQLRNARDDVEQKESRRDASTFDLLGDRAKGLGAVYRNKASQLQLDTGYRSRRAAQDDFAEDPSESNRLKLQLANLFIRATKEEDAANKAELFLSSTSSPLAMASLILNGKGFEGESGLWLRYARLERQILLRERAQAMQDNGASPVAERMLALSQYGRQTSAGNTGNK
jgi:hypothetical protein